MIHALPSNQLSSLVYCYRRLCFKRWQMTSHKGRRFWCDNEIPWSIRHWSLVPMIDGPSSA